MVSFEQILEVVLDEAVRAAFEEAAQAGLPLCQKCVSASMARHLVREVFPALRADYDRRRHLTQGQVRALIEEAGRLAAHAHCV